MPQLFFFRYDGETFVKEVDVNYIMWERHGRAGYKYSSTMKEVCHWWRVSPFRSEVLVVIM